MYYKLSTLFINFFKFISNKKIRGVIRWTNQTTLLQNLTNGNVKILRNILSGVMSIGICFSLFKRTFCNWSVIVENKKKTSSRSLKHISPAKNYYVNYYVIFQLIATETILLNLKILIYQLISYR